MPQHFLKITQSHAQTGNYSFSSSNWSSPQVSEKTPDDLETLWQLQGTNHVTTPDHYPLPQPQDFTATLQECMSHISNFCGTSRYVDALWFV